MELRFTVEGKPVPKERARKGGGHWYTPERTRAFEASVRLLAHMAARDAGLPLEQRRGPCGNVFAVYLAEPVRVDVHVFWGDARRHDGDNVYKAILDGLQPARRQRVKVGIGLLDDDDLVHEHHVYEAIDRVRPRVEVRVAPIALRGSIPLPTAVDRPTADGKRRPRGAATPGARPNLNEKSDDER